MPGAAAERPGGAHPGIPAAGAVCGMIRAHKRNESIREIRDRTAIRIPGPIALESSLEIVAGGRTRRTRRPRRAARAPGCPARGSASADQGDSESDLGDATRRPAPDRRVGGWDTWSLRTHILGVMHISCTWIMVTSPDSARPVVARLRARRVARGVRTVRSRYMFWSCPMSCI